MSLSKSASVRRSPHRFWPQVTDVSNRASWLGDESGFKTAPSRSKWPWREMTLRFVNAGANPLGRRCKSALGRGVLAMSGQNTDISLLIHLVWIVFPGVQAKRSLRQLFRPSEIEARIVAEA